jgi:linoleoyl-CoA desaturase
MGANSSAGAVFPLGGGIKFEGDPGFHAELKRRVHAEFRRANLSTHGGPRIWLKSAILLAWFGASYALLVFGVATWWLAVPVALSLVFAMAGIGFSIQHDANHGAYSSKPRVNRLMGLTLDMVGASSYLWYWKHNVLHHTYPNVAGADPDLDAEPFARLSTGQAHRRLYRLQQFYMWGLYGFLFLKWHLVDDFQNVVQGRILTHRIKRPRGLRFFELLAGKAVFFGWALVVPLLFHRWWVVLVFYGAMCSALGLLLAVVFQLAHCTEEAGFLGIVDGSKRVPESWAAHQVHTTVDFARTNRLLTWYLGGLNFQIEHHLFPRICHIHYPRISRIVEAGCAEYGLRYVAHEGVWTALSSHWRWLARMGRNDARA